jgi:hypothetical protein
MPWINNTLHIYWAKDYDDWFFGQKTTDTPLESFLKLIGNNNKQIKMEIKLKTRIGLILKEYFNKVGVVCGV